MPDLTKEYEPIYVRLKSRLRGDILSGRLKSLSKLPTVRELAAEAGVSVGTMGRVVGELVDEGLCIRRPRIGVYVNRESALDGRKTVIHLHVGSQPHAEDYGQQVLALDDSRLYPHCDIQNWYVPAERLRPPTFSRELEKLRSETPDCLLLSAPALERDAVKRLMELPFPTLFIGDFFFGELRDPDLNLIREDSSERGYELVKAVQAAGGRSAAFFGGAPDHFYVKLLRAGADLAAREFGIVLRYCQLVDDGYEALSEAGLQAAKREHLEAMLRAGRPDVLLFDGHTEIDIIARIVEELGLTPGKDIKLISNRELVPGCIFVQPDYAPFRREAAELITRMANDHNFHPGSRTLSGKVKYRLVTINAL